MATQINKALHEELLRFVNRRIEYIRSGDREGLDATYSTSCLNRRNKYNQHDYAWYLHLIEDGFGDKTQRIDIEPIKSGSSLPFLGMVTYPWSPEYKVFVQTVSGRRTLWLIRMFEDGPRVVLPAFGGQTADRVATGEWQLPGPTDEEESSATILEFHADAFISDLAEAVALRLDTWSFRFKFETIRALALDCAPWFGQCYIALLTTKEDFPEEEYGKWAIGDWRWNDLEDVGAELCQFVRAYYEGKTITDPEHTPKQRAEAIFKCLAKAILSEQVRSSMARFDLANDFELGVFDPDDPEQRNYCKFFQN